ncbi:hypothetical protein CC80DRAFT_83609 [Byssothecium circinans]|uniref:Uncharacterized protein n=1 Tax=Byssothecium circinans TaxID=147558 RepID=A0A6A5TTR0_9PLEO|nr:hypothetical protein CC80DRAFT_83609 [Byssothecium circinans]
MPHCQAEPLTNRITTPALSTPPLTTHLPHPSAPDTRPPSTRPPRREASTASYERSTREPFAATARASTPSSRTSASPRKHPELEVDVSTEASIPPRGDAQALTLGEYISAFSLSRALRRRPAARGRLRPANVQPSQSSTAF